MFRYYSYSIAININGIEHSQLVRLLRSLSIPMLEHDLYIVYNTVIMCQRRNENIDYKGAGKTMANIFHRLQLCRK